MRRFGQLLIELGAAVGVLDAIAMATHLGLTGVPWLVNWGAVEWFQEAIALATFDAMDTA